jgi:hypothetical protein
MAHADIVSAESSCSLLTSSSGAGGGVAAALPRALLGDAGVLLLPPAVMLLLPPAVSPRGESGVPPPRLPMAYVTARHARLGAAGDLAAAAAGGAGGTGTGASAIAPPKAKGRTFFGRPPRRAAAAADTFLQPAGACGCVV